MYFLVKNVKNLVNFWFSMEKDNINMDPAWKSNTHSFLFTVETF